MSWVTIVVIIIGCLLALFTVFLVFACCRMASVSDNAIPRAWTDERIARKLEDIAYSDEKNLSGLAINTLLETAEYYKSDEDEFKKAIPLICNIRVSAQKVAKNMSEDVCTRYALMKGCTQNALDESPCDIQDVVADIIMDEINKAIVGEFPQTLMTTVRKGK